MVDYYYELKKLIKIYKRGEIDFGKNKQYILERINATQKEIEDELYSLNSLEFIEKQIRKKEVRYALFYVYSKRKGRVYVLTFREKIRIITAYPLGTKTMMKYNRKRFIKFGGQLII